ncbi:hypothetical protein [Rhodococcus sp. SJ-2]
MTTPRTRKANAPAMDNAPQPQDHKSPARREAEGDENVTITFRGHDFIIPADQEDWPIIAVQAFSNGRNIDAIQHLLGPRQWAVYSTKFPKSRDFNEFAEVIAESFGFGNTGN